MKKFDVSVTLTSVILSGNFLTSSPVIAQINLNNDDVVKAENLSTVKDFQLSSENQLTLISSDFLSDVQELKPNSTIQSPSELGNSENSQFVADSLENQQIPEITVAETQKQYSNTPPELEQIVNVNQLQDVTRDHWAYEALRNLVEKYQCIDGDGQGNFNGNRAMTRYEFAAVLDNCLLKVVRSISSLNNKFASQEDLTTFQRLQEEFGRELQNINAKIDSLEEKTALIQQRQFSTTTVLRGAAVFNLISGFGDRKAVPPGSNPTEDLTANTSLSTLANLTFDTSFTGKDRLRTQLLAGNINGFGSNVTGTNMTSLTGAVNTGNNVILSSLFYEFPIGDRGILAVAPVADFPTRIFPALNPVSSISTFGAESPIYSFAFGGGAIAYYQFTDTLAAGISYLSSSSNAANQGLFNGQYTALTQVTYTPSDKIGIAFTYGHYYAPEPGLTINITGSKGSQFAQLPFGGNTPTSSDAFGLQFTYKLTDKLIVGGWTSYFKAQAEGSPTISNLNGSKGADADIWSWAFTASLTDLGKLGSQLSFVFGMPPKVTSNDILERRDPDTSLHFELSYRYPVTDRILITPGFLMITNPEHNTANDTIWIGLMRTTFVF
ncbi:membrane protein [Nostoc linckia z18]|uniref:Membrane protein n=2 Tax=Nostoc linckia TaxID=92942 RepID=A0A9Q5Z4I5_NOSLI|nr:iron uptake porin [Nostoc linckia]PHK35613.1 membrane protein [Nostoc linckia z15]PHK41958.1 membrane protein [Nostoc linckia z16]PHJ53768.1 membrane protein [Nostoc linckia z1]PHJ56292.1 membrane protein [Nostoc linckia z3]PHJ59527.1 membrane protein [Nostoc linckia z2]